MIMEKKYQINNKIRKICKLIINLPKYVFLSIEYMLKKEYTPEKDLGICAIIKNEGQYIEEWIEHHINVGVSRFFLFDNDSEDDTYTKIKPFIQRGLVVYEKISGKNRQYDAYNLTIKKYKNECKYIAFIDCDEFLMPCNTKDRLIDILTPFFKDKKIGGVAANWRMYGSSGFIEKPKDLVLCSFLYRANDFNGRGNNCIKSIVNPRKVFMFFSAHYPIYLLNFYNVDENGKRVRKSYGENGELKKIRINHYFTKSKNEWITRRSLGKPDTYYKNEDKRTIDEFYLHDNNEIYDEIGLYYGNLIKEKR